MELDPRVQAEFDEIRAIIREGAIRAEKRHQEMDRRIEENERRFNQRMNRAEKRMELADKRMDKFEQKLEATRKLVEAGIKMVSRLASDTRELKRTQQAFLASFRNGRNGHSH